MEVAITLLITAVAAAVVLAVVWCINALPFMMTATNVFTMLNL